MSFWVKKKKKEVLPKGFLLRRSLSPAARGHADYADYAEQRASYEQTTITTCSQ